MTILHTYLISIIVIGLVLEIKSWMIIPILGTYVHPQRPFRSRWADQTSLKNERYVIANYE